MTVRAKILIGFLSLSMVALGVVGYAAFSSMSDMDVYALTSSGQLGYHVVSESSTALESNAEASILRLATDQADISDVVFEQVESEMDTLVRYAATVQILPMCSAGPVVCNANRPFLVRSFFTE
jgi:sigma-B regulation protein RsbU (phosphoserine phosphatase)